MTVGLGDITNYIFDYRMGEVYTSIPAYIVSIENKGELRVNVQPSLNMRDENLASIKERPTILNVPVYMPTSRSGGLTYDINVGDVCQLIFSMRGLETWKRSNGMPTTPASNRRFSPEDAVAFVGGFPFGESPNRPDKHGLSHDPRDVVLYHNLGRANEVEVRLKFGGGVEINAPNDKVEVNCRTSTVNATNSVEVNTRDFTINSNSFKVNSGNVNFSSSAFNVGTGTYSMSATDSATSVGTFSHNGSWILNGKNVDGHTHPNVQSGNSNTGAF